MKRTTIGDIYMVRTEKGIRFFQYIDIDKSDLSFDVIRVFSHLYSEDEHPTVDVIINDSIDFYTHTSVLAGVKMNLWEKYAFSKECGTKDIYFRGSLDIVNSKPYQRIISERWVVWKVNEERRYVGVLPKEYHNTDLGGGYPPVHIVSRIKTGKDIDIYYPSYE